MMASLRHDALGEVTIADGLGDGLSAEDDLNSGDYQWKRIPRGRVMLRGCSVR